MSQYRIAVVVGSLRRESFNRQLANAIIKMAPSEFSFESLQIADLPLYNQDDDANQAEPVKRLKGEIKAAQGLIFVTPEYNRSLPGVLKNAIDHASRPYGQNAWATLSDSKKLPVNISITLLHALHARWGQLLEDITESQWQRTVYHPERKMDLSLWDLLKTYAWHGRHHTAQILRLREKNGWN